MTDVYEIAHRILGGAKMGLPPERWKDLRWEIGIEVKAAVIAAGVNAGPCTQGDVNRHMKEYGDLRFLGLPSLLDDSRRGIRLVLVMEEDHL